MDEMLSITKLQILKAIHNALKSMRTTFLVVINHKLQNLKTIHNVLLTHQHGDHVVINHKTAKFESNSQLLDTKDEVYESCYQSQNYKI